jgi:glucosyl-dolichyl phosphate glucuronosyltransferase
MAIDCSVIICTYNRCSLLVKTLRSLMEQSFPADRLEIIVVDNNSTDDTAMVVRACALDSPVVISYLLEMNQGLSHARNLGLREARGELIAFIDDDATAEKTWLARLLEGFNDPRTACVGGRVVPAWQAPRSQWPKWLHERLIGFFSVVEYPDRRELHYPDYPAGTNIAFRMQALKNTGIFNPRLGRTGTSLLSMEETDLCLRLERAGHRIVYTPEAVVSHTITEERLTRDWVRERARWQGISAAIIEREFFPRSLAVTKSLKYLLFIGIGFLGIFFGRLTGNERLEFFCICQITLCQAYLQETKGAAALRGQSR